MVVLATQPAFSPDLLGRAVVAAEVNQIDLHILLNKCALKDNLEHACKMIEPYARMGYAVSEVSPSLIYIRFNNIAFKRIGTIQNIFAGFNLDNAGLIC
ncbi:GTPase RsgA [Polynucleobacter necessarius]|uniref:GTPase RsgA n=1 Tax=Polynucleobacter necessarius TaxID=576610 RepID=UPI001E5CC5EE|nr:GTPase RsgA [Polynucleobacter necessarius]